MKHIEQPMNNLVFMIRINIFKRKLRDYKKIVINKRLKVA